MHNETKSMVAERLGNAAAAMLVGLALLLGVSAVAQPVERPPTLPAAPPTKPGNDNEFIVKPPAQGNPGLLKPAPPGGDPDMVKKPPAEIESATPDDAKTPRSDRGAPSRKDDCRGTAEDCKQNSPR